MSENYFRQYTLPVVKSQGGMEEIMSNVLKLAEIKFQYVSDKICGHFAHIFNLKSFLSPFLPPQNFDAATASCIQIE